MPISSARRLLAAAATRAADAARRARAVVARHYNDGTRLLLHPSQPRAAFSRLRNPGPARCGDTPRSLRMGPNEVHVFITRMDGSVEDLGLSFNLLTNIGRDWQSQIWGFIPAGGQGTPATATSATSLTGTGTPWTASNLATPQLGLAGLRVVAPVTGVGTAPVYANIISNTSSVLTLDQWWTAADGVGTTPASTNSFIIMPGGASAIRFIALTLNTGAASASDTTLTGEITANGCGRALGAYAHTYGQSTTTLTKTFSATGTETGIVKAGAFTCLSSAGADPMIYETVISQSSTLGNGDTMTLTWTFTLSG